MKKTFLPVAALILMLAGVVQAQTEKGRFALSLHNFSSIVPEAGGLLAPTNAFGIGFGTSKTKSSFGTSEYSYTTVGLSGSGHYFIANNFSAGLNLNFLYQRQKEKGSTGSDSYSATVFLVGPELRYYFQMGAKTKLWVNGNGGFGSTGSSEDDDDSTKLTRFGGGLGLAIFPSERFSIDLGLGYGVFIAKNTFDNLLGGTSEVTDTNGGVVADVGFSIFL